MTFMEMLKIKNLTHDFVDEEEGTKLRAVDNVSLDVEKGQFITVLGHNGSGKHLWQNILMHYLLQLREQYF